MSEIGLSAQLDRVELVFAETRNRLGVDQKDEAQAQFTQLLEAGWDMALVGDRGALTDLVRDYGYDTTTESGYAVSVIVDAMYRRSEYSRKNRGS